MKRGGLNPVNWVNIASVLWMLQTKACRRTPPGQYYSNSFANAAMWKYNIYLATCKYSFDNRNVLEELSLLFEDLEILAFGIQMLNWYIHT